MLVVVALVVLMMTILVQIFQSATGAIERLADDPGARRRPPPARLDDPAGPRRRHRQDDPAARPGPEDLGYFEYGENAFADLQGEDTDDYLAFTVKAPEGQVFTGRRTSLPHGVNGHSRDQPASSRSRSPASTPR